MIRISFYSLFVSLAFPLSGFGVEDSAPTARTLAGGSFEGQLIHVDPNWRLRFAGAGQDRTLPASDLVRWSTAVDPERGPVVYLADGSLLVGEVVRIVDDRLLLLTDLFGEVSLSLKQVRGILLTLPQRQKERDQLEQRITQATGNADRLIFENGDELPVTLEQWKDNQLRVVVGGKGLEIQTKKLVAVILNPKLVEKTKDQPFTAFVGFQDGSLLHVKSMTLEGDSLQAALVLGQPVTSDQTDQICSLLPSGADVFYLSDNKPHQYQFVPFLDLKWNYHLDRSVLGTRLRAGERLYSKGIGVHSGARLTYKLDQPYQRFQAELAIDDQSQGQGSVTFRVLTTDGKTWNEAYTSPTIHGGDKPHPVEVEIRDAKAIALVVDHADRGDVRDYANWLGARLIK